MGSAAGLAHAGAGFQKRNFTGGQAAVMDEVLAQGTARPPAAEKRLVAVEPFLADLAVPGFNPQQHRLPCPSEISNTHAVKYSEAVGGKTRRRRGVSRCPFCSQNAHDQNVRVLRARRMVWLFPSPSCLTASRPFVTLRADSGPVATSSNLPL